MELFKDMPVFLKDFLIYTEIIQGKSKTTVNEYYLDIRTFLRYLKCSLGRAELNKFDEIIIDDLTIEDIRGVTISFLYEYMYYITKVRENAGSARARKVSSIKSFFKYLTIKAGHLSENPAKDLEAPKLPELLPKYLTLDESLKLLSSVQGEFVTRDYAIITLFLNCGLRLSELVGINIKDFKENKLTVIGKGNRQRIIYINEACQAAVNEYLKVRPHEGVKDRDALFLSKRKTRISGKMVQVIVKKAIDHAGLDTGKYSVHKLRHTAATLMYKHGDVDVRALQEILGHRQLSTTQIYTHVDNERLKAAAESNPLAKVERTVKKHNDTSGTSE